MPVSDMSNADESSYTAREELYGGARTILLRDHVRDQSARILMYTGNTLMEFNDAAGEYIYFPEQPAEFARSLHLSGNPLLHPWANRLRGDYYHFAAKRYDVNGGFQRDGNGLPLHGMVLKSDAWEPATLDVDDVGARYTARLEWEKVPGGPANFPFPHTLQVTHHLSAGALRIQALIENTGSTPMPACIGFHPYFRLTGETRMRIPANNVLELNERLLPTGAVFPARELLGDSENFDPAAVPLDHVFSDLRREQDGWAWFRLGTGERILHVGFDENYPIAVIYAPAGEPFACVEPMTAPTDALNLSHEGAWPAPPAVEPGESFQAEFILEPGASRD